MADSKITALAALTAADPANDMVPIVDVSDTSMAASGTTKRISINNILACSPSATLASLNVTGSSIPANGLYLPTTNTLEFSANSLAQYRIAPLGVFSWYDGAGGTRMTLNSTGLGVGVSPTQPLTVRSSAAAIGMFHSTNVNGPYVIFQNSTANFGDIGSELAITGGGSAGNLTLNSRSTSNLCFAVSDSVKMRIDSSGNVGIGVAPSAWNTYKAVSVGGIGASVFGLGSSQSGVAQGAFFNNGTGSGWAYSATSQVPTYYLQVDGENIWSIASSGTAGTQIAAWTQAMKLDASGNLLLAATSFAVNNGKLRIQHSGLAGEWGFQTKSSTTDGYVGVFYTTTGQAGFISVNGTSTTFSTTSDYRLKESVQPLIGGLARINNLKPSTYKWKADGSDGEGFIAHELAEVVPAAVTGQKDAVNADGSIKPQGVDLSKLVPVLVAAIQELTARVQTLEAK